MPPVLPGSCLSAKSAPPAALSCGPILLPLYRILPSRKALAGSRPSTAWARRLFPDPLAPTTATTSPRRTVTFRSVITGRKACRKARRPLPFSYCRKRMERFSMERSSCAASGVSFFMTSVFSISRRSPVFPFSCSAALPFDSHPFPVAAQTGPRLCRAGRTKRTARKSAPPSRIACGGRRAASASLLRAGRIQELLQGASRRVKKHHGQHQHQAGKQGEPPVSRDQITHAF